ncbi:MAG: hypothetical protein LBD46_01355 [Endomicrobium sp.]|jgi:hypothetical protein|nr:hypothetical protein [Endomicrobium sp.]
MQIVKKYQNEIYGMAFSLTCNEQTSRKAAIKAFENLLRSYYADLPEIKTELYKKLLKNIGFFDIKKKDLNKKGMINSIKHNLRLFDKKVFILKYEFNCSLKDMSYILNSSEDKIKKSLYKSVQRIAQMLEDGENEM